MLQINDLTQRVRLCRARARLRSALQDSRRLAGSRPRSSWYSPDPDVPHSPLEVASSDARAIASSCLGSFEQHSGGRGPTDRAAVEVQDGSSAAPAVTPRSGAFQVSD